MKTTFLTLLCFLALLAATSLRAQVLTQKSNIELGGDITFSSQSESDADESLTTFSFNPYIGIFITDNFEMGFRPGISTTSFGDGSLTTMNLFLAPAYNWNIGGKTYPYVEFLLGYNSVDAFDENYGGLGVGFDGGLKVSVAGNSLLLVKLEYLHQSYSDDNDNDYSINTLSFGLGFRVFLARAGGTAK